VGDSAKSIPITTLFGKLSFITNTVTWEIAFRSGYLKVSDADYEVITAALK